MRYLDSWIIRDLAKKMVFISGPRQSGKTTLAKDVIKGRRSIYLNWDDFDHRKMILKRAWADEDEMICLDEIHKYSRWKNFLKGTYDTQGDLHRFLITGSARLDIYRKGQDSMLGRFFSWRLHPFCLAELKHDFGGRGSKHGGFERSLERLLALGGFPEPFLSDDATFAKRWRKERMNLIFRQDIQEIEKVRDISLVEFFYDALTSRVGGEVVLSNIARDLEIAPKTAKAWLDLLERTFTLFVVQPYSKNLKKAILKTPKVYFFDNAEVSEDEGARFENLVATHLLKKIHFLEDSTGDRYELKYLRDKNGHEIDFVILKNRRPIALIEAKVSDQVRSRSFYYYRERLKVETCVQLLKTSIPPSTRDGILVTAAADWLSRPLSTDFV